jgi:carboxymethylenebutenolidase
MLIDASVIDLTTPSGAMRTHCFAPRPAGRYPGIVFYSEIFQVTGPIRRTAALLAGNGFVVAVPEVYHELEPPGSVLPYTPEGSARGNAHKSAKSQAQFDHDTAALIAHLQAAPACTGAIASLGVCLGGHLAFRAARAPAIRAAVCLYPTDLHQRRLGSDGQTGADAALDGVRPGPTEYLMIFGRQDPHIPAAGRAIIYQALEAAGATFEWHEFNAAHAFLRDEGPRYDPALALSVYDLCLRFLQRTLSLPPAAP